MFAVLLAVLLLPQAASPIVSSAAVVIAVICLPIVFMLYLRVRLVKVIYIAVLRRLVVVVFVFGDVDVALVCGGGLVGFFLDGYGYWLPVH